VKYRKISTRWKWYPSLVKISGFFLYRH